MARFYLEYRDADLRHPIGYRLPVEADELTLGRDHTADVIFYDDFPTVSRRHAAIRLQQGDYYLVPLSVTNSTLLNGRCIHAPEPLSDGDEIRLSTDGPRLGVIGLPRRRYPTAPQGTAPQGVYPQGRPPQAPYQSGSASPAPSGGSGRGGRGFILGVIVALVVVGVGLGIWKLIEFQHNYHELGEMVKAQQQSADSVAQPFAQIPGAPLESAQDLPSQYPQDAALPSGQSEIVTPAQSTGSPSQEAMKIADRSVYYVMALGFEVTTPEGEHYEIECGDGEDQIPGWSGTGFLLSDGRFVTARHVVEPWYYIHGGDDEGELMSLNILASNGGKVVSYIGAVSPTGDRIVFKSTDCRANRSADRTTRLSSGERVTLASMGAGDFAAYSTGRSGGLPFSGSASRSLRRGTKLTVLSFPLGLGANSYTDINPVYGTATVAADGLQEGMILTTETTYEKGSSGGPVFITDTSGRLVVVGITSAIAGRSTGFIEPIASIR